MQDEPYIKAITNHIHLAQIWLISELEMSSRLFVISEFCWCEFNIYFKNWANLKAHMKQFLQIKKWLVIIFLVYRL